MICGFNNNNSIISVERIEEEDIPLLGDYILKNLNYYTFGRGFSYKKWKQRYTDGWLKNYYKISDNGNVVGYFSFNSLKYNIVYSSLYFVDKKNINILYKASVSFTSLHSNIKFIKFTTSTPYSVMYSIHRFGAVIVDNEDGFFDISIEIDKIKKCNLYKEVIFES